MQINSMYHVHSRASGAFTRLGNWDRIIAIAIWPMNRLAALYELRHDGDGCCGLWLSGDQASLIFYIHSYHSVLTRPFRAAKTAYSHGYNRRIMNLSETVQEVFGNKYCTSWTQNDWGGDGSFLLADFSVVVGSFIQVSAG